MEVDKNASKSKILDASIKLLASKGFAVSLREIAREVNVSPGLIIHHFGNRDGLIQQAIQTCLGNLLSRKQSLATPMLSSGLIELFLEVSEAELIILRKVLADDSPAAQALFAMALEFAQRHLIDKAAIMSKAEFKVQSALLAAQALGSVVLLPQLKRTLLEDGAFDSDRILSNLFDDHQFVRGNK